jgi:hypothetical protein
MITGASIFTSKDIIRRDDGTEVEMTTRIYSFDTDDPILPPHKPKKVIPFTDEQKRNLFDSVRRRAEPGFRAQMAFAFRSRMKACEHFFR